MVQRSTSDFKQSSIRRVITTLVAESRTAGLTVGRGGCSTSWAPAPRNHPSAPRVTVHARAWRHPACARSVEERVPRDARARAVRPIRAVTSIRGCPFMAGPWRMCGRVSLRLAPAQCGEAVGDGDLRGQQPQLDPQLRGQHRHPSPAQLTLDLLSPDPAGTWSRATAPQVPRTRRRDQPGVVATVNSDVAMYRAGFHIGRCAPVLPCAAHATAAQYDRPPRAAHRQPSHGGYVVAAGSQLPEGP